MSSGPAVNSIDDSVDGGSCGVHIVSLGTLTLLALPKSNKNSAKVKLGGLASGMFVNAAS